MKNPFKDIGDDGGGRVLTFLLVAAGVAVVLWLVFGRGPQPTPANQVTMTCTCRPAGGEQR